MTATQLATSAAVGPPQAFGGREFRAALGAFATGVTVTSTRGAEHAYDMTASPFSSVSLDPPLVLVCVVAGTEGAATLARSGAFAVSILFHHGRYRFLRDDEA